MSKETSSIVQQAEKLYLDELKTQEGRKEKRTKVCSTCVHRNECWYSTKKVPDNYGCETRYQSDGSINATFV